MYSIDIDTPQPYRVHIGTFLLEQTGAISREAAGGSKAIVVTDSNVAPLYSMPVKESLEQAGYDVKVFTFTAGEKHKRLGVVEAILEAMAAHHMTRSDLVVALGGGVTGDMAGFAAATYMRGCPFVQVPTTLLAMVDSSVGGKTGVDLACGKNLAGAFWQPRAVIADVGCLATLTPEQFADGCGEVIKHAAIADESLFAELEQTPLTYQLLLDDVARVAELIARNIDIKRAVVVADEREDGIRKLLNFGHSIGHAIESSTDYALGHGACVGLGMVAIARAAHKLGACDASVQERIARAVIEHGLTIACPVDAQTVFESARHDKKCSGDTIDLVIPHRIGACSIDTVALEDFRQIIEMGLGPRMQ